jgi:vacuolar protein sorting-associated protein 11
MKQVQGTSLLVTIAEDLSSEPILKVWALDKLDKKTGVPTCTSTLQIQNGRKQFPISAFAALDDLSQLAVGFANGAVTVVRGDLIHDRGTRQRTVFESEEPITGIEFREAHMTTLYIATTSRIATLVISGRGQGQPPRTLDENGCSVNCMALNRETNDVIISRDDALYYYGPSGKGPTYPFECPKKMVTVFNDYVAVVATSQPSQVAKSSSLRTFGAATAPADNLFHGSRLTLLDPNLRFNAFEVVLASQVKFMFSEWGDLFILTIDGKVTLSHLDGELVLTWPALPIS